VGNFLNSWGTVSFSKRTLFPAVRVSVAVRRAEAATSPTPLLCKLRAESPAGAHRQLARCGLQLTASP